MKKIFVLIFILSMPDFLFSAPPAPGKKGFAQKDMVSKLAHRQALAMKGIIKPTGTTITYKVLVIRVEFQQDFDSSTTGTGIFNSGTKANVESFMNQLNSYYSENTYGMITISATVTNGGTDTFNSYRLNHQMSYYGDGSETGYTNLLTDAVNKADPDVNFSQFDHFMIYHAGSSEETDLNEDSTNDIWSMFMESSSGIIADGKTITSATFVPETGSQDGYVWDPLGVICHEYGHQLGLPDLYSTAGEFQTTLGNWSLMDSGIYIGSPKGSNPSHLDAWSKLQLGVIDPQEYAAEKINIGIKAAELASNGTGQMSTSFIKIPLTVADDPAKEYYLIEYRSKSAALYDQFIPASGILIWHIDDNVGTFADNNLNNNLLHKRVDLIEKDRIDTSIDLGRASNVFSDGDVFNDQIYAAAKAYNGKSSGIGIVSISGVGNIEANFMLTKILSQPYLNITKMYNYPNPAKNGRTSFAFHMSKPPSNIKLEIYNIAGEKVLNASGGAVEFNIRSANYDWVYEYPWTGINGDGDTVAPGIYLYRISADSEVKTGKFVVTR